MGQEPAFATELTVTEMVIKCPHALGLAVPVHSVDMRAGEPTLSQSALIKGILTIGQANYIDESCGQ